MARGDTALLNVFGGLMIAGGLLLGVASVLVPSSSRSGLDGPTRSGMAGGMIGAGIVFLYMGRKAAKTPVPPVVNVTQVAGVGGGKAPLAEASGGSAYAPCPGCGAQGATLIQFSWWGGVVGPKLLTHVECPRCGHRYNGKTGGSNFVGIAIYQTVALVAVGGLVLLLWSMRGKF